MNQKEDIKIRLKNLVLMAEEIDNKNKHAISEIFAKAAIEVAKKKPNSAKLIDLINEAILLLKNGRK